MLTKIREVLVNPLAEASIDRNGMKISNICILFKESKNNRTYSDPAMDDVCRLVLEGGRSFIDHQDVEDIEKGKQRPSKQLLGRLTNPHRDGDRVYADLDVMQHQSNFAFDVAERFSDMLGFSIDGDAQISPGEAEDKKDLVERVMRLYSADLVSSPATTRSLFESEEKPVTEALTHNSKVTDTEPAWGSVDKAKLPRSAFAGKGDVGKKSTWSFPHHWVKGGELGEDGVYESGDMFLHLGGLKAAWAMAQGARSGQKADQSIISHLQSHRKALGLTEEYWEGDDITSRGLGMDTTLRFLERLGADVSGIGEEDEAAIERAVDAYLAKTAEDKTAEELEEVKGQIEELNSQVKKLETEKTELANDLDEYKSKEKLEEQLREARKAIEDAELPEALVSDLFVGQVADADEETRKALIEERQKLAEKVREDVNLGGDRHEREGDDDDTPKDDEELIRTLKEARRHYMA